jgi:hypothetical protein
MVEEAGATGAEFESGAAGVVEGAAGACVLSGADELGGGTGPMRVFVSSAGAAEGVTVEVAGPDAVRTRLWTPNFSRSARKRASICIRETSK